MWTRQKSHWNKNRLVKKEKVFNVNAIRNAKKGGGGEKLRKTHGLQKMDYRSEMGKKTSRR